MLTNSTTEMLRTRFLKSTAYQNSLKKNLNSHIFTPKPVNCNSSKEYPGPDEVINELY